MPNYFVLIHDLLRQHDAQMPSNTIDGAQVAFTILAESPDFLDS